MADRQEVQIHTRGPCGGNSTPMRQGHVRTEYRRRGAVVEDGVFTARACQVEVVGARPCRTRVKRREALAAGEPAASGEAQFPQELRA